MEDCAVAFLKVFSLIHKGKLLLSRPKASQAAACNDLFVAGYCYLASFFLTRRLCRFHMEPTLTW